MAQDKVKDDFDKQFDAATGRGRERRTREPRVIKVDYDRRAERIRLKLSNGCTFMFPPDLAQGLRGATAAQLSDVEIYGGGLDLNWRTLDAQFDVAHLLTGIFGTKKWMAGLGRVGGTVKSEVKAANSRANGRKGGRPRKAA